MTTQVKNEQKKLNAAISGKLAHDSRALEQVFEVCRTDEKKMTLLIYGSGLFFSFMIIVMVNGKI